VAITSRPLLAVDGDSFAHRANHALPKSIRRRGDQGGGAIVGFANLLLRLYEDEKPRAVLVGWDTLDAPTYRHNALKDYQGGRDRAGRAPGGGRAAGGPGREAAGVRAPVPGAVGRADALPGGSGAHQSITRAEKRSQPVAGQALNVNLAEPACAR
jgi:5'-3' exonuclease